MADPKMIIDVKQMKGMSEGPKKVAEDLNCKKPGEYAEIVADDERMLELALKMIKGIGKA